MLLFRVTVFGYIHLKKNKFISTDNKRKKFQHQLKSNVISREQFQIFQILSDPLSIFPY